MEREGGWGEGFVERCVEMLGRACGKLEERGCRRFSKLGRRLEVGEMGGIVRLVD